MENATRMKKILREKKILFSLKTTLRNIVLEWRWSWCKPSPTLKPLTSYRIQGSGNIWVVSVGVCFPCAPLWADWLPACAGSGWGMQGEIWLTAPPQCASLSFILLQLFFCECGFWGTVCVWFLRARRSQKKKKKDLKGCIWGKSKLSLQVCVLWITHLDACPLTLCWLQLCSGKLSHGSAQTVCLCKLED